MIRRSTHRRSGFALFLAVAMLTIVAVVILVLSQMTAAVARTTQGASAAVQLRQLLRSGQLLAARAVKRDTFAAALQSVHLPGRLGDDAKLTLTLKPAVGNRRQVAVQATFKNRVASEQLSYERSKGGWQLIDAELNGAHRVFPHP